MYEKLKGSFIKISNVVIRLLVVTFFAWTVVTLGIVKRAIFTVQNQNNEVYEANADIFTSIVYAIKAVHENSNQKIDALSARLNLIEKTKNISDNNRPTYEYMRSRTVYVVQEHSDSGRGSIGTGIVIKVTETETHILTNKHVCVFSEETACFIYHEKEKYELAPVKQSELNFDAQVVKTLKPLPKKEAIIGIKDVQPQDRVYMVGNNNGNPFLYSEGTVSGFDRRSGDLIVGMPAGPGNSGSGIFDNDGYVVGLLYAGQVFPVRPIGYAMDTSHGICVNSKMLRLFLSDYFI